MAKTRLTIPKVVREAVLKEFNHRCAICGADRPQVHHIDEDPSNNEVLNLIPLCPNCHLVDQHNPTTPMNAEKLRLFREFKDPTILKPQFHPLFTRMKFLRSMSSVRNDSNRKELENRSRELIEFIVNLEMGNFYAKKIWKTLETLLSLGAFFSDEQLRISSEQDEQFRIRNEQLTKQYREELCSVKEQVYLLIVELLRFQKW